MRDERLLGLEEAVRKMTGAPAARWACPTGRARDGPRGHRRLDPATVRTHATYDEPRPFPVGIPYVIVNGGLVVDDGTHTGATQGRGIHLGRD